jgi:alpha,alpha-trehalase
LVTTLKTSGQQWDAPNGWAPLQWIAVKGLLNYEETDLAEAIAKSWINLNLKVYNETGKLMEKYDVNDLSKPAGGGEYPSQDGFGWTNGVLLKMIALYGLPPQN